MSSFVSLTETRAAAELVYSGVTSVPSGWQIDATFGDGGERQRPAGGYAYALKPSGIDDGRRMLVFRGTEVTLTNLKDLFADVTDIGKTQFGELRDAVNQWLAQELVAGRRVELVGHSLGGALVQWAINDTNKATVTNIVLDPETGLKATEEQFASQLHFTTFNAPGITYVLGGTTPATDRTSEVVGEHHIVVGYPPIIQGDPIHLLGGAHVGGRDPSYLAIALTSTASAMGCLPIRFGSRNIGPPLLCRMCRSSSIWRWRNHLLTIIPSLEIRMGRLMAILRQPCG